MIDVVLYDPHFSDILRNDMSSNDQVTPSGLLVKGSIHALVVTFAVLTFLCDYYLNMFDVIFRLEMLIGVKSWYCPPIWWKIDVHVVIIVCFDLVIQGYWDINQSCVFLACAEWFP